MKAICVLSEVFRKPFNEDLLHYHTESVESLVFHNTRLGEKYIILKCSKNLRPKNMQLTKQCLENVAANVAESDWV